MANLTSKQQRFVAEYLVDLNATQAAIRAGYSERTARSQGQRMLTNVDIQEALTVALEQRSQRTEIGQDWVVACLVEIVEKAMQDRPVLNRKGESTGPIYIPRSSG